MTSDGDHRLPNRINAKIQCCKGGDHARYGACSDAADHAGLRIGSDAGDRVDRRCIPARSARPYVKDPFPIV